MAYVSEFLKAELPQPYYAALGRRAWVEITERYIGPDVSVMRDESPYEADLPFVNERPAQYSASVTGG